MSRAPSITSKLKSVKDNDKDTATGRPDPSDRKEPSEDESVGLPGGPHPGPGKPGKEYPKDMPQSKKIPARNTKNSRGSRLSGLNSYAKQVR